MQEARDKVLEAVGILRARVVAFAEMRDLGEEEVESIKHDFSITELVKMVTYYENVRR